MKKSLIILFLISIIVSANSSYYEHKVSQFKELLSSKNEVMMLGDSITDRGLWRELLDSNVVINRGISGDTTKGVLNRLYILNTNLKKAFIMIGVNDLLGGESVRYVFKNYVKIIKILKQKGVEPIVESTLYVGRDAPKIYNKKIEELNELLKLFAKEKNIKYIDLNKKLAPNGYLSKEYSRDGLHLNGKAYKIWAKEIKPYL